MKQFMKMILYLSNSADCYLDCATQLQADVIIIP